MELQGGVRAAAALLTMAALSGAAGAARVAAVSPSGEVSEVRQVAVRFDQAVVVAGDPRAMAPFALACNGQSLVGDSRWLDGSRWVLDLREPLGAGLSCVLQATAGWLPATPPGATLEGPREFRFTTGAPTVVQTRPWAGAPVEEDQHWLLRLNGAVDRRTLAGNAWCEVEGIGERIGLAIAGDAERDAVLRSQRVTAPAPALWLLARCERPLPAGAGVRLVWGQGIAAAAGAGAVNAAPPVTRQPRRFTFKVRERFSAEFSCERERAHAPCLPLKAMTLRFSAPVPRELALAARLEPAGAKPIVPGVDPANANDRAAALSEVRFAAPLPANTRFTLTLPAALRDETGRPLANATSFPLTVATGGMPPLAKFAAAPFGIVEAGSVAEPALVPMTLRHVQTDLPGTSSTGRVMLRRFDAATPDATLLRWLHRVQRWHESEISAKELGRPKQEWTVTERVTGDDGRMREVRRERFIATRELSLLADDAAAERSALPQLTGTTPQSTEVIGLPLPRRGYHVIEVSSQILGRALLDAGRPMYVRSGVLVTNLAVHFKRGRTSSLAWVTSLDRGRPVPGARVTVNDCRGQPLWSGNTDAQGRAHIDRGWDDGERELVGRDCLGNGGLFITARVAGKNTPAEQDAGAGDDLAFVFSEWTRGIEPWRFDLDVGDGRNGSRIAHTVFDRTLLRAGDTLSMKHFVRTETARGLSRPDADTLPDQVLIRHQGSGDEVLLPLSWPDGAERARSSESRWPIARTAKLGVYEVLLKRGNEAAVPSGSVRVEAFRVPLVQAALALPKGEQVAPAALTFAAQLNLGAGGPLPRTAVALSALLRPAEPGFDGYAGFSFSPPRTPPEGGHADEEAPGDEPGRLVVDRVAAVTDAQGAATLTTPRLPPIERPSELATELSYRDPNGETHTVARRLRLWPAAVVVGIRTRNWMASRHELRFELVVLDTQGRPLKDRAVQVTARQNLVSTVRRRIVGGFYAYDSTRSSRALGVLCSGRSDAHGRLACEARAEAQGEIELIASARDDSGRESRAAATLWVMSGEETWFEPGNDDRIDVLPERREVQPGQTVRLQVRMPFREATALVTVEREGVLDSKVVTLRGREPVVEVAVPGDSAGPAGEGTARARSWAPNAFVSVLVLRGRLRDVPWTSFFRWGWRDPLEWWRAFRWEGRDWRAPTALVDLAKPAFRFGVAELKVGLAAHRLDVQVKPEKTAYGVREVVRTTVRVSRDGRPVPGAEVAFAAVDEGLLALRENRSWLLLDSLMRPRPWGVVTATAQNEVIGRRHYGRKALPPGGDGGISPTRELFDTLLLWRGRVMLDARGEAVIEVPLNDSLTSFRLVAMADAGAGEDGVERFGTGSASVRVTQDLQLFSGLPPLAREGDRFDAVLTLRNTTTRAMKLRATLQGLAEATAAGGAALPIQLPEQTLDVPAGGAVLARWPVTVPQGIERIVWTAAAEQAQPPGSPAGAVAARDRLRVTQPIRPAVPLRVWQASLQQVEGRLSLPQAPPPEALPSAGAKLGGLELSLQPTLAGALPGLRRWFEAYPYTCIEQRSSRAIALRDAALWSQVGAELAQHLDADGLASYFPRGEGDAARGSDRLTAHLVAAAHEAGWAWPKPELERMLGGLAAFVEGRTLRRVNSPRDDLDVRKLAALEALSRHGRAAPRMLGSLSIQPQAWPTAALLDWWALLRRVDGIPERTARLAEVQALLRARLVQGGTMLRFTTENDDRWWWLMDGPDANAARLLLAALASPEGSDWKDDLPRIVAGHLARQRGGAWDTTVANLWGALAIERFAQRFEATPVTGRTLLAFGAETRQVEWGPARAAPTLRLPWPAAGGAALTVQHQGSGRPWLAVQALAAVPLSAEVVAGYQVQRSVTAVQRQRTDAWSVGDILRVRLEVEARGDMAWVVLQDPLPAGAAVLAGGIAAQGQQREGGGWLAFEERAQEAWRAYFEWLPRGRHVIEYSLRLHTAGRLLLPPTRVEAMYAPETFGERPNEALEVRP